MPTSRVCPNCQTSLPDEAQFCMHCGRATPTDPGVPQRTMHTGEIEVLNVRRALADRYRIERVIGEGGMATVFLAEDLRHRRQVAVKVMRPDLAATLGADRFLREVEIAAQLTHPNILPVYDSGEVQGVLYYVMPHVEGESLAQRIAREGELPVDEAIRLTREAAEALGYAHKRGIVHRDVKPVNILLNHGHALLADFGIARALEAQGPAITKTGLAVGTPQYMSPEQATGDRTVDARTDIYALGAVLYEMLTGEPPFTGRTPQAVIARMLTERPRPLGASREGLPAGLDAVVSQALARSPADRQSTAEMLISALHGVTAPQPAAAPTPLPMPAASPGEGSGKWIALGGLAMAALTVVSFVAGKFGLPAWVLWFALALLGGGAAMLALTAREESRRRAGRASAGPMQLLTWRNAALGGLVAVISWSAAAAVASSGRASAVSASSTGDKRVAVLPFQNQGDSTDNYVVDGITDEIRGKLARVKGLAVIASASSGEYRGSRLSPAEIAKELNADYLLVGRVRWAGGANQQRRMQVVSELVSRATGATAWQQSFEADLTDVFNVQGEIATRVATALGSELGSAETTELVKAPTKVPAAWDEYLKGKAIIGIDPAFERERMAHFERAVALDPALVEGWAALSTSAARSFFNGSRDPAAARRAREAYQRALSLDSNNAVGYRAASAYYNMVAQDMDSSYRAASIALRLAPNDPEVLSQIHQAAFSMGKRDEALQYLEHARELDPRSPTVLGALQRALVNTQRFQESIEVGQQLLSVNRDGMLTYEFISLANAAMGNVAAAAAAGQLAVSNGNSPPTVVSNYAGFWELSWLLDAQLQDLVPRLTPSAFDNDPAWWAQSLAMANWAAGRPDQAKIFADSALAPSKVQMDAAPLDPNPVMLYAVMLAISGKTSDALTHARRALAMPKFVTADLARAYNLVHMVRICVIAGDQNCALDYTQQALAQKTYITPAWLRLDPIFKSLKGNPRFDQLASGK